MVKLTSVTSRMNGGTYNPSECVRIIDKKQHDLYMKHGLYPVDMYYSCGVTVYVYDKETSHDCYQKWLAHELK